MTTLVAIVAVAVLGIPLLLFLAQDRLLFFPQPLSEAQRARVPAKEIFLATDGAKVHAWHVPGEPLVLYFGGNAEDVSWMVEQARRNAPGSGWLLVSYRGYGGSEGSPSAKNISEDALRWYDHARDELKAKRIFVFGRSLGSGAAVHVAANRPVAGAILVTPFDTLSAVAGRHYPFLPVGMMLRHRFDSVDLAPRIQAPLLCIAAAQDTVIPPAHARRLHDAWGGAKRWMLLEGAGHNSTDGMPGFWQAITEFLKQ